MRNLVPFAISIICVSILIANADGAPKKGKDEFWKSVLIVCLNCDALSTYAHRFFRSGLMDLLEEHFHFYNN